MREGHFRLVPTSTRERGHHFSRHRERDPEVDEAIACRGYLERQIALLKPKIILAVGRVAAKGAAKISLDAIEGR